MRATLSLLIVGLAAGGCGLTETATTAAAVGAGRKAELNQAQALQQQIQKAVLDSAERAEERASVPGSGQ